MFQITRNSKVQEEDAVRFAESLCASGHRIFSNDRSVFVARAPGRLDVMGGIADYSGSNVLQMTTAEAALAAAQVRDDGMIEVVSEPEGWEFSMPVAAFFIDEKPIGYSAARAKFESDPNNHWAAYVAGTLLVLALEENLNIDRGVSILIHSEVPQGKGVSSSAALEAASMRAVLAAFGVELEPRRTAILCQMVENLIVGAPCGIMDQMSVICGRKDEFMSMRCQPAELGPPVAIPRSIAFWGIDSGIRHSVGGGDYGSVRTGAFIGYRIIAEIEGLAIENNEVQDPNWNGYLCNISPGDFRGRIEPQLPLSMSGAEFLDQYGFITDRVTSVDPDREYAVLYPTAHPVYENGRVEVFAELVGAMGKSPPADLLGKLMYASHESYSRCGLGSDGTDLLVELVKKRLDVGLFGAKITGGGSGGTVAVLGRSNAFDAVLDVADEYAELTGRDPYVFNGTSSGAAEFGIMELAPE